MTEEREGMREVESASHEHTYGPWEERGSETVLFARFYLQARRCLDPKCGWTQHARTQAGARSGGSIAPD